MHRHRSRHHGTQPNASLMTRLDKSGFAGIAVSILALGLGIETLLQGKLQYSDDWDGAVFAPFAVFDRGAGNPRRHRHLAETALTNFVLRLCAGERSRSTTLYSPAGKVRPEPPNSTRALATP
jgi:hypothetical protein